MIQLSKLNFILLFFFIFFFVFFQSNSIYGGDAGDLVTSAYLGGIAHPPGYPLYTFLGFLLTKIPLNTVAFRVGLLSSVPAGLSLLLLFNFLSDLTKNKLLSFVSIVTLAFNYIFWLYAIVPEVFSLHGLLVITIIYSLFLWNKTKIRYWLYFSFLIFGISLSHHHTIIFLIPAILYLLMKNKYFAKNKVVKISKLIFLSVLGLTPYLYIIIRAHQYPPISWNNPVNLNNLIYLFTRSQYGSFQSGIHFASNPLSRFLQIPILFDYIISDFTLLGLILIIIGLYQQFKLRREIFNFIFLGFLFTGPIYFWYGSYLILNKFYIATYEKFLLILYIFLTIWLCEGIVSLSSVISKLYLKVSPTKNKFLAVSILPMIFFILPISFLYINYPKLSILKNDFTAENLGYDILATPTKNSILIVQTDLAVFNTQYIYYVNKYRNDIKLIHGQKLAAGELIPLIKKYYPDISIPNYSSRDYIDRFIIKNYAKYPIYSYIPFKTKIVNGEWINQGLLYRFYVKEEMPDPKQIGDNIDRLWSKYHHPLDGSLGQYQNLMLSTVTDYYYDSLLNSGQFFQYPGKNPKKAENYFKKAISLDSNRSLAEYRLAILFYEQKKCRQAIHYLDQVDNSQISDQSRYYLFAQIYLKCLENKKKGEYYQKLYQNSLQKNTKPLKSI